MSSSQFTPELLIAVLLNVAALVLSVAVHEFGHAFVADRLGDRLARSEGRVTLNPLAHADPWGTVVFPLIGTLAHAPVLGWGKPVRHALNPARLPRGMGMRTARLLVGVAGPLMNIVFALVVSVVVIVAIRTGQTAVAHVAGQVVLMNISLFVFNLIPIPPLDGRSILFWFLPEAHAAVGYLERYGMFLFIGLLLIPGALSIVMTPATLLADGWFDVLARLSHG